MQQIEIYLQKFKDFGLKEELFKEKIINVVKEEVGIDLKKEEIDVKDGNIRINISGPAKTEVFIKRKIIQEKLEKDFGIL